MKPLKNNTLIITLIALLFLCLFKYCKKGGIILLFLLSFFLLRSNTLNCTIKEHANYNKIKIKILEMKDSALCTILDSIILKADLDSFHERGMFHSITVFPIYAKGEENTLYRMEINQESNLCKALTTNTIEGCFYYQGFLFLVYLSEKDLKYLIKTDYDDNPIYPSPDNPLFNIINDSFTTFKCRDDYDSNNNNKICTWHYYYVYRNFVFTLLSHRA